MTDDDTRARLLAAALPNVAFDGWSRSTFEAAAASADVPLTEARRLFPRGAIDMAVALHRQADAGMVKAIRSADLSTMKIRERIAFALRARLAAIPDKEAVRRSTALFALPTHAAEGARLIWETADAVWTALGDPSRDVNWYSKRATLSAVWASVVLFWLGDDSLDAQETDAFIDRRIDDVMRIEKAKAQVRENAILGPIARPLGRLGELIRAPSLPRNDLPGHWTARP